jgi:hypothetical protein
MNGCVCPGDIWTYECTVMRGVATVWTGSALDCHKIVLLHILDEFHNISLYCSNGAIVGRSLPIEGNNYTSQLTETTVRTPMATSRVYIISFSCLATALFVGAVASLTVITIFIKRSKAKTRAVSVQSNRAEGTTHNEPGYENVTLSPSPSVSAINTQDNVAYGHTRTSTRRAGVMQDVAMYESVTDPISLVSTIDNVAYGCTQQL